MKWVKSAVILAGAVISTKAGAAPTFTVVTAESGVQAIRDTKAPDWWLSGLTLVDVNHDGHLDLFLSDHHGAALAAINDGTGKFIVAGGTYPTSEVHVPLDVDEDGKVDMDMTYADGGAKWWLNKTMAGSSMLQLTDVGNVDTREGNESRSEALADLNRDGKVDWIRSCQGQNFKVDFGDGHGNFAKDSALIAQPQGSALDAGMMFVDLDGDGDLDMIVNWGGYSSPGGDDYGRMRVLINDGSMKFVEKTTDLGLPTDHLAILGVGDVDQDGDVDLIGLSDRKFPEVLYLNDGHGHFTAMPNAVTGVTGSAEYALWGLATVTDLDNDGIADILIDGRYFFHVLRGTGGGHFAYQNDAWGKLTHSAEGSVDSGFAFGDIDGDGDLDLLGYTAGDPNRQIAVYRNDLPAQSWVNVRPVGLPGNRAGANSKIRVYEANSEHLLWFEEVAVFSKQSQQNYYAFDQLERHYGLAGRTSVDVTVTFYPSGTVVRKNGVAANSTVLINEDGTSGTVEPPPAAVPSEAGAPEAGATEAGGASRGGGGGSGQGGGLVQGAGGASDGGGPSVDSGSPDAAAGCSCRVATASTRDREARTLELASALVLLVSVRPLLRRRSAKTRGGIS